MEKQGRIALQRPSSKYAAKAFAQRSIQSVRRQGFWHQGRLKLRESLAHLIGFIMRRTVCDASVASRVSFV